MPPTLDVLKRLILPIFLPILLAFLGLVFSTTRIDSTAVQCTVLSIFLREKVHYTTHGNYSEPVNSYWSQQEANIVPSCVVTPESTADVSRAVRVLSFFGKATKSCRFAIRGGGHAPLQGHANIHEGITIDLRRMNDVTINEDSTVTSVGGGATWGEVYRKVDEHGLAVIGGRGSGIGVGGLTTGGGISYLTPRKGFACDNVVNFEVVLAGGRVVNANEREAPELWRALKGGSSNFGVVTRFDLKTYPGGDFWGGLIVYDDASSGQLLKAFVNLNRGEDYDEYAAIMLSFSFMPGMGYIPSANIEYTKREADPKTFRPFTTIEPQYMKTTRISNMTDFTSEFDALNPGGRRQVYITSAFKSNLSFLEATRNQWKDAVAPLASVEGMLASITIQPLPPNIVAQSISRGGNSLGLTPNHGPMVLCLVNFAWSNEKDDEVVTRVGKKIQAEIERDSKARGLWHDWVYLNYAAPWQDPIRSYGESNWNKMQAVSREFDPGQVFQKFVPGGFKIPK